MNKNNGITKTPKIRIKNLHYIKDKIVIYANVVTYYFHKFSNFLNIVTLPN